MSQADIEGFALLMVGGGAVVASAVGGIGAGLGYLIHSYGLAAVVLGGLGIIGLLAVAIPFAI